MEIQKRIKNVIPGGIDGNAKRFLSKMPIIQHSQGPYMYDIHGKRYIDYISGFGPLLFGHAHPDFIDYLNEYMKKGVLYGLPHELMYEVGEKLIEVIPSAEMVRFTNTGTEATLNAIRLARGVTRRSKIIKFYGSYHGTHDAVLIGTKRKSSYDEFPCINADSAGITDGVQQDTYTLQFNDVKGFRRFIEKKGDEIAAVIVEPVLGSTGLVAEEKFMKALREETEKSGICLIFDEIITGFRLGLGGAQEYYGINADITTLGKVLGGGLPIGAFTGKRELMERVIPQGDPSVDSKETIYHSGTFNANPLSLAASKWVLTKLTKNPSITTNLSARSNQLRKGFEKLMKKHGVPGVTTGLSSIFLWYFGLEKKPRTINEIENADYSLINAFHQEMVELGILFIGSPKGFVSSVHTEEIIQETIYYADIALSKVLSY